MEPNQNQIYADPEILRKLRQGTRESFFVKPMQSFPLLESKRTYDLSQAVFDALEEFEDEPNPDEVLRQEGFYDSTDKRCCINRSRR